jgi:hypothetical protein
MRKGRDNPGPFRKRPPRQDPQAPRTTTMVVGGVAAHLYGSGSSDAEVDAMARRAGEGSLNDNEIWGPNAEQTRPLEEINGAHDVNASIIGHEVRDALADVYDEVDEAVPIAKQTEGTAKRDIDEHANAAVEQESLRQEIKAEGLGFPHWVAHALLYALALAGLVLGDMAFNATAYELFGLSDAKLFGFIPYTDDLHVGAAASVAALVILAHVAGKHIGEVMHDLNRRRKAADREARQKLPPPSHVSIAIAAICIAAALILLDGIASIRSGFLRQQRIDAQALSFACIQAGIFAAALALAISHAHPRGRQWIDVSRRVRRFYKDMERSIAAHGAAVARVNSLIDRGNAILAQAGHHLRASRGNAIRQGARFAWVSQLHYPEPVSQNLLLPDSLPKPADMTKAETAEFLIGITGLPAIARMSTDAVIEHREQARAQLERVRRVWVDGAWPAAPETPDAEDPPAAEKADPAKTATTVGVSGATTAFTAPPAAVIRSNGGSKP